VENINDTIRRKEKELRSYGRRTSLTQSEIDSLADEIESLAANLDSRKQYLKEYINFLYKQQYGDNAFALTSATDYQDLSRKSKYISLLANYEGRVIQEYMNDVQEIKSKRKNLQTLIEELEANKAAALEKKKELQSDLSEKNELLSDIKEKQIAYEKKIKELEASSQKIQGVVNNSERKKIPQSILGDGFVSSKGHLPWPIAGKVLIPYGDYKDPVFNISTFKNGIEIEAGPDDLAKAVAGGRVIYAGNFEGYGMLLIIDHGDGYNSLYGNLSDVLLQKGELLIKGMELGKITKSKLLNTPALYFEIRYNGKPVDPMEWLDKSG
jgi:septal ring factor EnvC (AmiA/AmiB activator)